MAPPLQEFQDNYKGDNSIYLYKSKNKRSRMSINLFMYIISSETRINWGTIPLFYLDLILATWEPSGEELGFSHEIA